MISTWDRRTWISISRKLLVEKIIKQLTFCLFCLDSLGTQKEKHMLRQSEAHWFQRSMQSSVTSDISFKSGICPHPTLSFLTNCLGTRILLQGVTEWMWVFSFICGYSHLLPLRGALEPHRSCLDAPVPCFEAVPCAGLDQRLTNSLLTSEKQDMFLTLTFRAFSFIQCLLNINTKSVSELLSPIFQVGTLVCHPQNHTFRSNSILSVSSVEMYSSRKKSEEVSSTLVCTAPLRSGRCGLKAGFP